MLTAHEKLSRALARRDPSGLNIDESQRYQIMPPTSTRASRRPGWRWQPMAKWCCQHSE